MYGGSLLLLFLLCLSLICRVIFRIYFERMDKSVRRSAKELVTNGETRRKTYDHLHERGKYSILYSVHCIEMYDNEYTN